MMALWLFACGASLVDTSDTSAASTEDTGCWTGVRGLLLSSVSDPAPLSGGRVSAQFGEDVIETVTVADGSWSLPLWPGEWVLLGENAAQNCFTEDPLTVSVVSCEPQTADLYADLCWG